jgi:hypothetical protein
MKMLYRLLGLVVILSLVAIAWGQAQTTSTGTQGGDTSKNETKVPPWLLRFKPRPGIGSYVVRLDLIASAALHEYVVDGVSLVTETTIDTEGNNTARFYFVEPIKKSDMAKAPGVAGEAQQWAQELQADAASLMGASGADVNPLNQYKRVVKNYPTTTHAKTIEFRLSSKAEVQSIYQQVETALIKGTSAAQSTNSSTNNSSGTQ